MPNNFQPLLHTPYQLIGAGIGGSSGSRASISLNAGFVNGTSGSALAIRYMAMTADPIDEFYLFLDDVGGTIANITMVAEIFNELATNNTRPGTTSRDTSTATTFPASADKWIKFTFGTPYTPAVGEVLWIIASNTAGAPATDFPMIMSGTNAAIGIHLTSFTALAGYSTTNGFTTGGSAALETPCMIKQGSRYFGQPFTGQANVYASNTRQRGLEFTLPVDTEVWGVALGTGSSTLNTFDILDGSEPPGGSVLHSFDLEADTNQANDVIGTKTFASPVTLSAGVNYRAVLTFNANAGIPSAAQIEDYATYSSIFDALRGEIPFVPWGTIDNGAGGWTTNKDYAPLTGLYIKSFPASASQDLAPDLFTNTQTFNTHTITTLNTLVPSLFNNSQTFNTHTLTTLTALVPSLFSNSQTFNTHALTTLTALTASLFNNTQTFNTHTVSHAGTTQDIAPDLFVNDQAIGPDEILVFDADLDLTGTTVVPSLFTNTQTYVTHTLTVGAVNLSPVLYNNTQTFNTHSISQGALTVDLFTNTQTFNAHTIAAPIDDAWSALDKASQIVLSNADKTATNNTGGVQAGVRTTRDNVVGVSHYYYAEFVIDNVVSSTTYPRVGLKDKTETLHGTIDTVYVESSGAIFNEGASTGISIGAFADGDVISVAWNAGSAAMWFRRNGGDWNDDPLADPFNDIGGINTTAIGADDLSLWTYLDTGDIVTVRTEEAEYTHPIPFNHSSWMNEPFTFTLGQTDRFDNAQTFFTHKLGLNVSRFDNAQTYNTHVVGRGAVNLTAILYNNTQTFFTHAVGRVATQTARFDNAQTFNTHVLQQLLVIRPPRFDNEQTFFEHVAFRDEGMTMDALFQNQQTSFKHQIAHSHKMKIRRGRPM